ncbi:MAG: hypothetical protein H6526_01240 [Actinobacteria bacterium]|nr:hypothetical protein [Actinomycetota bacterium]MCB8996241.1 hypothetical protein [Actinomycetota bacterium]MCB9413884.1 hypothetical protein [Actinomycetota bacterium]HRY09205.1 hypothetical protein [Candidatus Nanopelagicales bacterium]
MSTTLTREVSRTDDAIGRRAGGWAALGQAATFIIGMILFATVVASADYGALDTDVGEHLRFLADNTLLLNVWYAAIYLAFGAFLVVQSLALLSRVGASFMARVGTAFGLIWATLMFAVGMTAMIGSDMVLDVAAQDSALAASMWATIQMLIQGLGGGIELVGGLWITLMSVAALRSRSLPKNLNYLGLVVGAAGILTTTLLLPDVLTALFGLGIIVWYVWIGITMLRSERPTN